jgi:hypothetical protein
VTQAVLGQIKIKIKETLCTLVNVSAKTTHRSANMPTPNTNAPKSTKELLEIFSDPELVSHGYLDTSLEGYNPLTQQAELHSATSQLLSELDHASQELTWELEDTMSVLKKSGPRLNYEVELLRSGVAGLVSDLDETAVDGQAEAGGGAANEIMTRLQQLEKVRQRMREVEQVFSRAIKFNQTEEERKVVLLLDNNDIEGAIKAVEGLSELVQVWKGTSVYSARVKFVASLRKRIEDLLSSNEQQQRQQQQPQPQQQQQQPQQQRSHYANQGLPGQSESTEGYYGLLGQLRGKIGY